MERRNIFDILKEKTNIASDVKRLDILFNGKVIYEKDGEECTLREYIDCEVFMNWKQRRHCLDLDDFLKTVNYDEIVKKAPEDKEQALLLIEILYNFCLLYFKTEPDCIWIGMELWKKGSKGELIDITSIMDDMLAQFNYKPYEVPDEDCIILYEDKPEVTAVAEIIDESLVLPVIRYNHFQLKGDIQKKKEILLMLGNDIEAKKEKLKQINSKLANDIFYMLNNLNIRHNNIKEDTSNYKKYVAEMSDDDLEKWYDELYQMILLGYILLDNEDRKGKVAELKQNIENN